MTKKIEQLNKTAPKKKDGRAKNGGPRDRSGPTPRIETVVFQELKTLIENHGKDMVEFKDKDGKVLKKARVLVLLDKLFVDGYKGNIQAIKEYLDRVLGKSVQPLVGEKDRPLAVRVISVDPAIAEKYDLNTSSKDNSGGSAPVSGG